MITQDTIASAHNWYETGIRRIQSETVNLGIGYLDKAIAVFAEIGEERLLTYARHYKLLGYKLEQRDEEVASVFPEVMEGYTRLEDPYGRALAFTHLAESLNHRGRASRALGYFNLASVLAENHRLPDVLAYVLEQQGRLYRERENQIQALRLFQQAEDIAAEEDRGELFIRYRFVKAETLVELGELAEAYVLLEDVQSRLIRTGRAREAIEPLSLLRRLYDDIGMDDDKNRVVRLLHECGQHMLRSDAERKPSLYEGPPIERAA